MSERLHVGVRAVHSCESRTEAGIWGTHVWGSFVTGALSLSIVWVWGEHFKGPFGIKGKSLELTAAALFPFWNFTAISHNRPKFIAIVWTNYRLSSRYNLICMRLESPKKESASHLICLWLLHWISLSFCALLYLSHMETHLVDLLPIQTDQNRSDSAWAEERFRDITPMFLLWDLAWPFTLLDQN